MIYPTNACKLVRHFHSYYHGEEKNYRPMKTTYRLSAVYKTNTVKLKFSNKYIYELLNN